LYYYTYFD